MTQQQERIKTALFSLVDNTGKYLRVDFIEKIRVRELRGEENKTGAYVSNNYGAKGVILLLIEADTPEELNQWGEAIVKAEELLNDQEKERVWSFGNPNFFAAVSALYLSKK